MRNIRFLIQKGVRIHQPTVRIMIFRVKKKFGQIFYNKRVPLLKKVKKFFHSNIIIRIPIESPDQIITKNVVLENFWSDFLVKKFKILFLMHP
jgi:hypothetical protein